MQAEHEEENDHVMGSVSLWNSHSQEVVETPSLESFSAEWKNCSIKEDYSTLEEAGLDEQCVFFIFNFCSFGKERRRKLNKRATWQNNLKKNFLIQKPQSSSDEQNDQMSKMTK